jgi:hypothetical protein
MEDIGGQADILRALGQWLDDQGADGIEIATYDEFVSVTWRESKSPESRHAYHEHELASLRAQAHMMRQEAHGIPSGSLAEQLRTLGQELDQDRVVVSGIVQEPTGFRVFGKMDGAYYTQLYLTEELSEAAARYRVVRGQGGERDTVRGDRFLQGLVGLPVYSRDNQLLGKIGDVRVQHIRVQTGLFQRDYWLAATYIASITAGERVELGFLKGDLDQHRRNSAATDD